MKTLTTITYKLDERFRLQFTNDWQDKYYHLQIINGDLTPLCYIPPASSGSFLCISGIPTGHSSSRIYELLVKNTYWIGKIYLLDAPKRLMDKIEEVKACNEDFELSFATEKNNANNIQDITPNLSKYIPEDNAVLFLSDAVADAKMYKIFASIFERCDGYMVYNNGELQSRCYRKQNFNFSKYTIFLPHGTQSELQKAEEVAKEPMVKYGVKEVNLFALHCFVQRSNQFGSQALFIYKQGFYQKDCVSSEEKQYVFNKIITTNSTGILKPEDSTERLQVIDAKEMLEEYLNENNLI